MTNEIITPESIVLYLNGIAPQETLAVVKTWNDVKDITDALIGACTRMDTHRKRKLLQEEVDRLKAEADELTHTIKQYQTQNTEHQQLSENLEILRREYEAIKDLDAQKKEIERLKAFIEAHDITALRNELQTIKKENIGDIDIINSWLDEADSFINQLSSDFFLETKGLMQQIAKNREQISSDLQETRNAVRNEHLQLSKLLADYDTSLDKTILEYNSVLEQLNSVKMKLLEIKSNHSKNISVYEIHLSHDKNIFGELGKHHNLEKHLKDLSENIEKSLRLFDGEIKALVEKTDSILIF